MGDSVRIRAVTVEEATRLQKGHGGWADSMGPLLGTTGMVASVDSDGDVRVNGKCWAPAMVEKLAPGGAPVSKLVSMRYANEWDCPAFFSFWNIC